MNLIILLLHGVVRSVHTTIEDAIKAIPDSNPTKASAIARFGDEQSYVQHIRQTWTTTPVGDERQGYWCSGNRVIALQSAPLRGKLYAAVAGGVDHDDDVVRPYLLCVALDRTDAEIHRNAFQGATAALARVATVTFTTDVDVAIIHDGLSLRV